MRRLILTQEGKLYKAIGLPETILMDILKKFPEGTDMETLERKFYREVKIRKIEVLLDILKSESEINSSDASDNGIGANEYDEIMGAMKREGWIK